MILSLYDNRNQVSCLFFGNGSLDVFTYNCLFMTVGV